MHLDIAFNFTAPIVRSRDGGKPPAPKLVKTVKPTGKRANFLRWFLDAPRGRTVAATMDHFGMTRQNVLAYWTAIRRDHGIGYALHANTITARLPRNLKRKSVFAGSAS